jgi:hypothetical protein
MKLVIDGNKWKNGKTGYFIFAEEELKLIELKIEDGYPQHLYSSEERYKKALIVAKGFVVHFLKKYTENRHIRPVDLYDTYYRLRFIQYKEIEEYKPAAFSRDLASEFHNKHIEEEQKHATYSKGFFDYLEDDNRTFIKGYCDNYFEYIKRYGVNTQEVPQCLQTEEAKIIFKKAIEAGFMNEDYSFNGTKYQMAYFADKAYIKLKLEYRWKHFQELWSVKNLSQTRHESIERFGHVPKQDEIDSIFD